MRRIICILLTALCLPFVSFLFIACKEGTDSGIRYEITAEYLPEDEAIFATQKVTYENRTEGVKDTLRFALYPNAYRKNAVYKPVSATYQPLAYYAGESYGGVTITSVLGGRGWQVCGEDENILAVELETPLYTGDEVVLDISFVTSLAKVNHRTGVCAKSVNLGNFYPILCADFGQGFLENPYYAVGDPFVSACADYTLQLKVPKDYEVASSGTLKERRVLESKKYCKYEAKNARDFALALSKEYEILEDKVGKTTVYYYHMGDERASEKLDLAVKAITYFSSVFGEYPYESYSVAQTGFCFGGMEYPALAYISDALTEKEAAHTIVHETAHQWWYAAVGSDQVNEAWQDEGLTEYSTLLFFEKHKEYSLDKNQLVEDSLRACRAYAEVYGGVLGDDGRMSRRLDGYLSDYAYRVLAYDKGVVMFDNLRKSVGDKKFFAALRRYYADNKYRLATPYALVGAFEKVGVDVAGYFEAFLQGKATI